MTGARIRASRATERRYERGAPGDMIHILIKPQHPWQNGKAERFNRTLQEGWAYRQPSISNQARTDALQPWLDFYNNHRPPGSLGGKPPISRCNQPTD